MRIRIDVEISDPELLDPDHDTGLTDDAYLMIHGAVSMFGDDIDILRADV